MRSERFFPATSVLALVPVLLLSAAHLGAQALPELGPAPVAELSGLPTKIGPSPSAVTTKSLPSRDTVASLYQSDYLGSLGGSIGWTGNIGSCTAGTTSSAYRNATMDMINFFRVVAGLPAVSNFSSKNDEAQKAALIMDANNALSHAPSPSWDCYSAAGAEGAGSSNLALGAAGANAIDLYMEDPGTFNAPVGHRRWILYPRQNAIATGSTPRANALYVFASFGARPATPSVVAWPPAGFVPYQVIYPRWSFSLNNAPNANYSNATVSVTQGGVSKSASIVSRTDNGFGDNTLVFVPSGISFGAGMSDSNVQVTIGNIGGAPSSTVQYTVTIIDPAQVMVDPEIFMNGFEQGHLNGWTSSVVP